MNTILIIIFTAVFFTGVGFLISQNIELRRRISQLEDGIRSQKGFPGSPGELEQFENGLFTAGSARRELMYALEKMDLAMKHFGDLRGLIKEE